MMDEFQIVFLIFFGMFAAVVYWVSGRVQGD
jgi:hypothetical protein